MDELDRANKLMLRKMFSRKSNRDVNIVYGSPRAGKTTYVKEHMHDDDLVIDLDSIISSLQLNDGRKKRQLPFEAGY